MPTPSSRAPIGTGKSMSAHHLLIFKGVRRVHEGTVELHMQCLVLEASVEETGIKMHPWTVLADVLEIVRDRAAHLEHHKEVDHIIELVVPQLERSVVVRSTIGEDIDDARCAAPLPRLVACATIAAQALAAASSNRVGSARRRRITRTIQDVVCDLWLVNRGAQAAAIVWVRRANPLGGLVVQLELATRTCAHHAHAGHTKRNVCLSEMQTEKVLGTRGVPPSPA
mmetsp:Transcript_3269/g.7241  ORF Transcript_3269/g.7241 Transcript_3269/m.7241 type:complete len:226 (+) Transcript_3269:1011-1688(+)